MCTQIAINEETLRLANKMANKYALPGKYEFDDLMQICSMSLMKAVRKFDPSKGYQFTTFACRIMQNDLNSYLASQKTRLNSEIPTDEFDQGSMYSIEESVENSLVIQQIKQLLDKDEFLVLWMHHVEGISQGEIATVIGSRQPQVCRILKRAKAKVKLAMGDDYGTHN